MAIRNTHMLGDLKKTFGDKASGFGSMSFDSQPQPDQPVFVTDIVPDKSFEMPTITAVNMQSTSGITVDGPDLSVSKHTAQATMDSYVETNKAIVATIDNFAKHVLGAEQGGQLMAQLTSQGSSMQQAISCAVDPTSGSLSTLLTVRSAISGEASHCSDPEVLAQLDKVLSAIQEASDPNRIQQADAPKIPEGQDFSAFQTAQQMKNFVERDIAKDPVMLAGQSKLDTIATIENNQNLVEERGNEVVTAAKVAQAIKIDDGTLEELVGAPVAEVIKAAPNITLAEVTTFGDLPKGQAGAFPGLDLKLAGTDDFRALVGSGKKPDEITFNLEATLARLTAPPSSHGMMA